MANFLGFGKIFGTSESSEVILKAPFKMDIDRANFCLIKTETLFKKILHRCYSKSEGAKDDDKISSLFDSAEKSSSPRGLISLVARAMTKKESIAIIYEAGIVRVANTEEKKQIVADYKKNAKSSTGVLVDFTTYCLTDLVASYMSMIYDILVSMNTQVGLAKALQIKINSLRSTVGANGKDEPIEQAKAINEALKEGRSVLLDKNDTVETLTLNSDSVKNAMNLVYGQLAGDIGVSLAFVSGELASGMSATGEADSNATEEGIQDFFNSVFKPVCDKVYSWKLSFITDDWRYSSTMIDKLLIVENSSILSQEQKTVYAERAIPIGKK